MKLEPTASLLTQNDERQSRINALMTGILVAYALTAISLIGYSVLITYSTFTGQNLPIVVTITALLCSIIAGFDAARGAESRGWPWGIIAGFFYAAILTSIGVWVNKGFVFDSRTVTMFVLSVAGGGLGGVIGINLGIMKKSKK